MRDYEEVTTSSSARRNRGVDITSAFSTLMRKVYVWMTLALVVSGLTAGYVAGNEGMLYAILTNKVLFYGLMIGEVVLVIGLSAAINRISALTATLLFLAYAVLNGATLSILLVLFTATSLATTFFVTAGTFVAMALVGSVTKMDLTKMGSYLIMAVVGLIIASVVNMFMQNSTLDLIVSGIGVLVFTGLTAYDAQKIKEMMLENGTEVNEQTQKLALLGALTLYLDFINLFLYLLRFLGNRRD